ncbi:LemA family protein [Candidatus Parcubacteria bacterium]|nr:LemA family protein [Candidatus Parcubacteria bacterium]
MTILYIIIAVVLIGGFWFIGGYNGFVRLKTRAEEAWADIDVQLKRRYDLIPNLVNAVKGYAAHEQGTFDAVTEARAKATQTHVEVGELTPEAVAAMSGAEAGLTQALGKLMAISENYPELKANENFLELQRELSDTENKIQAARRFYNGNVRDLNMKIEMFPSNIIAGMFSFDKREFFDLDDNQEQRENVKVEF